MLLSQRAPDGTTTSGMTTPATDGTDTIMTPTGDTTTLEMSWFQEHIRALQETIAQQSAAIQALQNAQAATIVPKAPAETPSTPTPDPNPTSNTRHPQRKRLLVGQPFDSKKELFVV